ncbi:hypothetical protein PT277_07360 [Acetobacteraceae bacterium ESL0709]|nr:hypothetical protein [Acetobacteraceae bacterium ESL0697]MDF7678501.1 hypothetical protein [Acetobacteraceae bacterium ESL0709]
MIFPEETSSIPSRKSPFLKAASCIGLLSFLVGCADHPPETFPKPDYSYLPKMNLNIARLDVSDDAVPKKNSLAAKSPIPPDETLRLMAHQRLNPTGTSGAGLFTITEARISGTSDDILIGDMTVRLTLDDDTHGRHAEIIAQVTHQDNLSGKNSKQHELYELTRRLMDDMNVELEYQIRKNMGSWLTDATGTPLNAAIKSQSLDNITAGSNNPGLANEPGRNPLQSPGEMTAPSANPMTPAMNKRSEYSPDASSTTPETPETLLHSPPPGELSLP